MKNKIGDNKLLCFYGLAQHVEFCSKCLISNQRPSSTQEFKHNINSKKKTIEFDENGISSAWHYSRKKKKIDWKSREKKLQILCDKFRNKKAQYDCIVPGSGGKDSAYAAHILKKKYNMNPLTVTWPPILYTDYGYKNFKNWIDVGGFDNLSFNRNGEVLRRLVKLSVKNLLHPFQSFILGQKSYPIKVALKYKIPLIFYGENEAEYGNPLKDNNTSIRHHSFHTFKSFNEIYLGGVKFKDLVNDYKFNPKDLLAYLPPQKKDFTKSNIEVHYLGYYLNWIPQEVYYYAVENTGFKPRPFRTDGTYTKFNSIDDKIDDLHYYTTYIKFGYGRCTEDVAAEIRNDYITVDEGKALIKKYDGEFPKTYMKEILDYLEMSIDDFNNLCNKFRSPHIWKEINNKYFLRHTVNKNGTDDI
jgi:N-acetyl sugar amidotransferase